MSMCQNVRVRWCAVVCAVTIGAGVVVPGSPALGQVDPTSTTSSSTSSTSSTSIEGEATTTTTSVLDPVTVPTSVDSTTTTTTIPDPYQNTDEGARDDTTPPQQGYDAASRVVLNEELLAAMDERQRIGEAQVALQGQIQALETSLNQLHAQLQTLGESSQVKIEQAAVAKLRYRDALVQMMNRSDDNITSNILLNEPFVASQGRKMIAAVTKRQHESISDYLTQSYSLTADQQGMVDEIALTESRLVELREQIPVQARQMSENEIRLKAFGAGSRVFVRGFVFPVLGQVVFSDDYGAPRLAGTAQAHSHQGCDVMAPFGRELVASENGVLAKVGVNGLGGNRLWVKGVSGTEYYYAHLQSFAPGIADGVSVRAGQVLGYVGNTGDARWGPPHLHFEIHPNGAGAVNPYPMLKAAYGDEPMGSLSAVLSAPGSMLDAARAESLSPQ